MAVLGLAAAFGASQTAGGIAFGQGGGGSKPPATGGKARVQGYTRTNKHTGQPEQVRPYKRRPPAPRPVQVQPYTRGGKPVGGHERQPPSKPADGSGSASGSGSAGGKKTQTFLPLWTRPGLSPQGRRMA